MGSARRSSSRFRRVAKDAARSSAIGWIATAGLGLIGSSFASKTALAAGEFSFSGHQPAWFAIGGIFVFLCAWLAREYYRMILVNRELRASTANSNDAINALRLSEAWLEQSQRLANIGNWERDLASGKILWSDQVYRIFGFKPGSLEIDFQTFIERVHPDDRERIRDRITGAVKIPRRTTAS